VSGARQAAVSDTGDVLGLARADLASCVQCGLCLPHCPTYRVTGLEARSPRGRIEAMRDVDWRGAPVDDSFLAAIDTCVGCLGCESACPSAVPYGRLVEGTRSALARDRSLGVQPRWRRAGFRALGHPALVRAGALAVAVGQRLGLGPALRRRHVPRLPVRRPALASTGTDVVLVTGCVMDAVQRDVHAAAVRVLGAAGVGVTVVPSAGCCGALAAHAGLRDLAADQARTMLRRLPPDVPILVDSAGCGAQLKDVGHLLGTAEAAAGATRVQDVSEYLATVMDRLPPADAGPAPVVAVQDPCHLRHAQRAHLPVRTVLAPYASLVELDDDGLCCGAGGSFAMLHPAEAGAIRDRKVAAIQRSGAQEVVSANPGCALHLQAAGLRVRHPVQVIDDRLAAPGAAPDRTDAGSGRGR
jgi:glycolate oxidase iron-sulfur subunit